MMRYAGLEMASADGDVRYRVDVTWLDVTRLDGALNSFEDGACDVRRRACRA